MMGSVRGIMRSKKVSVKRRRGFTLIEMILVIASLATFLALVFGIYKTKVEPARWSSNMYQKFQSVVAALEDAKSANGGGFPEASDVDLSSTTAPTDPKAKLVWSAVTGGMGDPSLVGWTYTCSGGNLDITVNISDKPSTGAATVFINKVINNTPFQLQSGDETSDTVTFRRTGVVCN